MASLPARASWIAAISLAALVTFGIGIRTAAAQNAAAEALFTDGEKLLKEGKLAEACDAFEASNRLEPRAGTLINLGTCREQNQQLASAWSAFKDALSRVKDPKKKKIAETRVKAIEPRLSYLTISVPDESRVEGLIVLRDAQPVDPALWNRGIPVDGGRYVVSGRAPGHEEWATTIEVPVEGAKITVEVPRFKELVKLVEPPPDEPLPPMLPPSDPAAETRRDDPGLWSGRRKVALGLGAVALGAAAGGVVLGRQSARLEDDAFALCPDPEVSCPEAAEANATLDRARDRALYANIAYGVGGAAAITAVVLWITGAPEPAESRVAVTPRLGPVTGVDLAVRF